MQERRRVCVPQCVGTRTVFVGISSMQFGCRIRTMAIFRPADVFDNSNRRPANIFRSKKKNWWLSGEANGEGN